MHNWLENDWFSMNTNIVVIQIMLSECIKGDELVMLCIIIIVNISLSKFKILLVRAI